jgi:hypothetical protein
VFKVGYPPPGCLPRWRCHGLVLILSS